MADTYTIWVCQDCIMHHANGECGNCHVNLYYQDHETDAHDREPLGLVDNTKVTMGMMWEEHDSSCLLSGDSGSVPLEIANTYECNCETMTFSWSSCEGCGSTLGGERHAMTLWFD